MFAPIMENQMEKNMENDMESWDYRVVYRGDIRVII